MYSEIFLLAIKLLLKAIKLLLKEPTLIRIIGNNKRGVNQYFLAISTLLMFFRALANLQQYY